MNVIILFAICSGIFGIFSIKEVIALKKDVRKLNAIVTHLLEDKKNEL